jgi:mono/diheme cytochrome c family protein
VSFQIIGVRSLLRKWIVLAAIAAAAAFTTFFIASRPQALPASALGPHTPNLENGRTMFVAGNCGSCHATPNQDDPTRLGGGLALKSDFGTFYPPNISPDENDGIGAWSEADFVTAMVRGTTPDGWHLYPVFPYTSFQRMSFDDVRDLFAYIKTLPPVAGVVEDNDLPIHFKIRRTIGIWKLLYMDGKPFQPDPSKSAQWNRGAYLVNGPAHCAECHSPRNFIGGIIASQRFAGGPDPSGDGWIPNITQKGLADWSEKDIASMLESGDLPDGDRVGGEMVKVVRNTSQLSAEDRAAIAAYIKSLPPVEGPKPPQRD